MDKTNLDGRFDIQLYWTPDVGEVALDPGRNPLPPVNSSGPSIFAAIQEQLGLILETTKGPVDLIIIDHVEQPSADYLQGCYRRLSKSTWASLTPNRHCETRTPRYLTLSKAV